jgi:hypothetical protein
VTAPRQALRRPAFSYDAIGEGRPVLALHGMISDRRVSHYDFETGVVSSRDGWNRVCVDLPGRGDTVGASSVSRGHATLTSGSARL